MRNSAAEFHWQPISALGLYFDELLLINEEILGSLHLHPVVHHLARRVLDLDILGAPLPQFAGEDYGVDFGHLLRQGFIELKQQHEHLGLLYMLELVFRNQRDQVGFGHHAVEHSQVC